METENLASFLREREEKLGNPILYRTFCTWYGRIGHEMREYGVFLCTDGKSILYEDFERNPQILGIPLKPKNSEKYEKLEAIFPISDIVSADRVTYSSAYKSVKAARDLSKEPNMLERLISRLVARIRLKSGDIIFLEMMDFKDFAKRMKMFMEDGNERIQGL